MKTSNFGQKQNYSQDGPRQRHCKDPTSQAKIDKTGLSCLNSSPIAPYDVCETRCESALAYALNLLNLLQRMTDARYQPDSDQKCPRRLITTCRLSAHLGEWQEQELLHNCTRSMVGHLGLRCSNVHHSGGEPVARSLTASTKRKRKTKVFPFLLPMRCWQAGKWLVFGGSKWFFYLVEVVAGPHLTANNNGTKLPGR